MVNGNAFSLRTGKHNPFILSLLWLLLLLVGAGGPALVSAQTQMSEFTKLTVSGRSGDAFSNDVAIHGNTMIVGAIGYGGVPPSGVAPGAAFIYVRNASGAWIFQQALSNGGLGDYFRFGSCVGISGNTVVVGAPGATEGAFIFTRSGTTWTQQALITLGSSVGFGQNCDISGDSIIVSARGGGTGSAYIFARNGTVWTQQAQLTAISPIVGDIFGDNAVIDGDTAVVGVPQSGGNYRGSVQVFVRSGTVWSPQQKILASDSLDGGALGSSVSINGDTLVAGSIGGGIGGAAYIFTRSGSLWTQQQKIVASDARNGAAFGTSVAVENNTLIIGSAQDNGVAGNGAGSAYVFQRSGVTWAQTQKIFPADLLPGHHFGATAALRNSVAVIGAVGDYVGVNDQGSAFVFVNNPVGCTFALTPASSAVIPASGGVGNFTVTTQVGCQWQATVQDVAPWVVSTDAGTGSGTANLTVAANTGRARRAEVFINGRQTFWVNQAPSAPLRQGDFDSSFGNTGLVTSSVRTFNHAYGVALQPDGRIIAVGQSFLDGPTAATVIRYNPEGTLDTSFNGTGIVAAQLNLNPLYSKAVVQPDGKIVVAGHVMDGTGDQDYLVVRYLANGALDNTFGTAGIVRTNLGSSTDRASALRLTPDNKIVVAGLVNFDTYGIVRYLANGALDTTFGGTGIVLSSTINGFAMPNLAIQTDGKILVTGSPGVFRYNTNGTLDTTFDGDGFAPRFGRAVAIQPDGKIVSGSAGTDAGGKLDFALTRINTNGSLDASFGVGGTTISTDIGLEPINEPYTGDILLDIALQPNGKIVAVGSVRSYRTTGATPTQAVVVRYNANGTIDTTFGRGDGIATVDFAFPDVYSVAESVVVQADGKIVVAGVYNSRSNEQQFLLMRLLGEGTVGGPDAPRIDEITPGNQQITIAFTAPAFDGGSAITGYTVTCRPAVGAAMSASGASSPLTVTGLTNGVAYTCAVHGTNIAGNGVESAASFPATPATSLAVVVVGSGSGSVSSSPAGIACPGDCFEAYGSGTVITLTATANGGSQFMGWLGSGCTGTSLTCTVTVNGPQTVSATFAPQTTVATLDIGATTSGPKYRATTDGVLVLRHMLGMTGNALINGAIGAAATRTSAAAITTYLTDVLPMLDIDGNGQASAMTDGLLVMRSMFGFTGAALINGVVGSGATRPAATQIENYLRLLMP